MKVTNTEKITGVVAEYKGKFWGTQYKDGQCTHNGYGSIEDADISDPEYCKKPTDKTHPPGKGGRDHDYYELKKAQLVKVKKTIVTEIEFL